MLNDDQDMTSVAQMCAITPGFHENERYYAEVPALALNEQSRLIEQIIHLAFDTLGVRHLEVRVCGTSQEERRSPRSLLP